MNSSAVFFASKNAPAGLLIVVYENFRGKRDPELQHWNAVALGMVCKRLYFLHKAQLSEDLSLTGHGFGAELRSEEFKAAEINR